MASIGTDGLVDKQEMDKSQTDLVDCVTERFIWRVSAQALLFPLHTFRWNLHDHEEDDRGHRGQSGVMPCPFSCPVQWIAGPVKSQATREIERVRSQWARWAFILTKACERTPGNHAKCMIHQNGSTTVKICDLRGPLTTGFATDLTRVSSDYRKSYQTLKKSLKIVKKSLENCRKL